MAHWLFESSYRALLFHSATAQVGNHGLRRRVGECSDNAVSDSTLMKQDSSDLLVSVRILDPRQFRVPSRPALLSREVTFNTATQTRCTIATPPTLHSKTLPMASATPSTIATPTPSAVNLRPSAANHKPGATRDNASVTNNRAGATNVKPRAAKPNPLASNNLKPAGAPKPEPGATMQMGPAQLGKSPRARTSVIRVSTSFLDAVHRKVIQSIDGAGKAMSTARANVETAKSSKEGRNKVVAKASEVVGALLTPGRHVVGLLSGLGALFPPCKQVSSALAVSVSSRPFDPRSHTHTTLTGTNQA
jgi:hypothetical protein